MYVSVREILRDNQLIDQFMQHLIGEFSAELLLGLIEFQQFKFHLMEMYGSKIFVPELKDDPADTSGGDDNVVLELADTVPKSDIVYSPTVLGFKIGSKKSLSNLSTKSMSNSRIRTDSVPSDGAATMEMATGNANADGGELKISTQKSERFDALNAFQIKALQLYNKYVRRGAEFEINVSCDVRDAMDAFMLTMMQDHIMTGNTSMNPIELASVFDPAMKEMMNLLNDSKSRFSCHKFEQSSTL